MDTLLGVGNAGLKGFFIHACIYVHFFLAALLSVRAQASGSAALSCLQLSSFLCMEAHAL